MNALNPMTMLIGFITSLIVQGLRKVPWIPLNGESETAARFAVVVLNFLALVVTAYLQGPSALAKLDPSQVVSLGAQLVGAILVSGVTHFSLLKASK